MLIRIQSGYKEQYRWKCAVLVSRTHTRLFSVSFTISLLSVSFTISLLHATTFCMKPFHVAAHTVNVWNAWMCCIFVLCFYPVQSFHPFFKMDVILIFLHGFPVGELSLSDLVWLKRSSVQGNNANGKCHFISMSF